jgi:hypothetical protein
MFLFRQIDGYHSSRHLAKLDFATRAEQIRADFADVEAKQKAREQSAKDKSSWIAEGRRRMATVRSRLSERRLSRRRVVEADL